MDALQQLPGIGPRSARRLTYHLLLHDRGGARELAEALQHAVERVGRCEGCRNLSEEALCNLCTSTRRDDSQLCIVESAADVEALESATGYSGRYFVLNGHLSPLDGIGPNELGIELLLQRFRQGSVSEVILATNPTVEGDATADYISGLAVECGLSATRIAHGVPVGGELEYIDSGTLRQAFAGRRSFS
ncbi:MAG: recombination mediator RecR [Gammaproteobacteria bacterium]|nr:recombination mediator RecR [Gammaproteobacteria bacterium]